MSLLTPREKEVVRLLPHTNLVISKTLGISARTVKQYIANARRAFGIESRGRESVRSGILLEALRQEEVVLDEVAIGDRRHDGDIRYDPVQIAPGLCYLAPVFEGPRKGAIHVYKWENGELRYLRRRPANLLGGTEAEKERARRIRSLAANGMSSREIERAIFGYASGHAYRVVKQILG